MSECPRRRWAGILIENLLSMSKGFFDHDLFHDPNVTTIHCDYPDNWAKDVRNSILWPSLVSPKEVESVEISHTPANFFHFVMQCSQYFYEIKQLVLV